MKEMTKAFALLDSRGPIGNDNSDSLMTII